MPSEDRARVCDSPVFFLKGSLFLPHYTETDVWVTYDGGELTTDVLEKLGGIRKMDQLWPRSWVLKKEKR